MNPIKKLTRQIATGLITGLCIFGWAVQSPAATTTTETVPARNSALPSVEVVFVLDTTGSMGGLIAAAKDKIWSIANTLASAEPAPEIKMGLVGYRDRGDAYVTTLTPLSTDLDAVYAKLMQFEAGGGGDTPESVNQALNDAVTGIRWSHLPQTYRVIFLVGDAPPQMNYKNDVTYHQTCRMAASKNIVINTIQCGNMSQTRPVWREIARMGEGRYFQVAQSGSAVLYDTPYDDKISSLSRELDATRVYYGTPKEMQAMKMRETEADKIYRTAEPSAVAKRAIFNAKKAGRKNFAGHQELVDSVASGNVELAAIPKSQLPPDLQSMSTVELNTHIDAIKVKRKTIQTRIATLAKQRQTFIEEKVRAEKDGGEASLDAKIYKCIQTQAQKKGIRYTQGPEY